MADANGWNRSYNSEEKKIYMDIMMDKGLTPEEAKEFVANEISILRRVQEGHGREYIIEMACTPITFGRK